MRPCLGTSASPDVILDLNPIFAVYFQAFDELFVLFLRPSAPMRVDVLRGFPLGSSPTHQLRCLIILLSHSWISEAHALWGNPHEAEVILVERRFVLVSHRTIRWGLLILYCGLPIRPMSGRILIGLLCAIISELLGLSVIGNSTNCIDLIICSLSTVKSSTL